jgi:hypothetical protein
MTAAPEPDRTAEAFILTGSFPVIRRAPEYLNELARRGLAILVITSVKYRDQATSAIADTTGPAAQITEIAYVSGDYSVPGAFVAGALAKAGEWRRRYRIVGAYAVGDYLAEANGLIADGLGVASPGLRASRACRSKVLQRWYAAELSPPSLTVPGDERDLVDAAAVTYPVVVKPAGRSSSSGVIAVDDAAALRLQLRDYPEDETILVEHKVLGPEFSVESLVQAGEVIFSSATAKRTTDSHSRTFVELAHSVPTGNVQARGALLAANRRLLELLAFEDGIAHSEWRLGPEGPVLMEIAARTPGDGLLVLYQLTTGQSMEPEILRLALRERSCYPAPKRYARQVYLEHEPGVLQDVTLDWPGVTPEWVDASGVWPEIKPGAAQDGSTLRAVLVLKARGAELVQLRDSDDRAVTFFIDAPTPEELDELELLVRASINVHTWPPC